MKLLRQAERWGCCEPRDLAGLLNDYAQVGRTPQMRALPSSVCRHGAPVPGGGGRRPAQLPSGCSCCSERWQRLLIPALCCALCLQAWGLCLEMVDISGYGDAAYVRQVSAACRDSPACSCTCCPPCCCCLRKARQCACLWRRCCSQRAAAAPSWGSRCRHPWTCSCRCCLPPLVRCSQNRARLLRFLPRKCRQSAAAASPDTPPSYCCPL